MRRDRTKRNGLAIVMPPRHAAFRAHLKELGYEDSHVRYRPNDMCVLLKNDVHAVCRRYVPTFFVEPELTIYDVGGNLTPDEEDLVASIARRDGYEFQVVTEAEFPFDEYLTTGR